MTLSSSFLLFLARVHLNGHKMQIISLVESGTAIVVYSCPLRIKNPFEISIYGKIMFHKNLMVKSTFPFLFFFCPFFEDIIVQINR